MVEALRSGDTFASAAASHPEAFPPYYLGILELRRADRQPRHRPRPARGLHRAGHRRPAQDDLRPRSTRRSSSCMSIVTVVILAAFVLPRFKVFFTSLHAKLPLPTRMLLAASGFVTDWWYMLVGGSLAVTVAARWSSRRARKARAGDARLDVPAAAGARRPAPDRHPRAVLPHPVLDDGAGVGASRGDGRSPRTPPTTRSFTAASNGIREQMLRGQGLAGPLAQTGLFPTAARQMFRVGEETGTLDRPARSPRPLTTTVSST